MKQKATIALFLVTIVWGWTFIWLKNALDASAPYTTGNQTNIVATLFVTMRFSIAVLLFFLIFPSIRKEIRGFQVWHDGMILALLMTGGFVFQMIGLEGISPAVSAFLTSLYVLFTALILAWHAGKLQSRTLLFGVVLATFGAGYIQGPPELHYDISEWLTILCALMFAGHIIATDVVTKRVSPLGVTFPTKMSPGLTSAPIYTTPDSSKFLKDSSLIFGMSRVISSVPNFVSLAINSCSSICTDVKTSSVTHLSEIKIESSKL